MGCQKLTYYPHIEVLNKSTIKTLTQKNSVLNVCNYTVFGVQLDVRTQGNQGRFGFQGQESDDEIKGEGNSYDFGARMYDARVGRWFSRDLLERKYPGLSPFTFVNNNPVISKDINGNDWVITTSKLEDGTRVMHVKLTAATINNSGRYVNMNAFSAAVKSQVESSFSITYMDSETSMKNSKQPGDRPDLALPHTEFFKVQVVVEVDIRVIEDSKDRKATEHLIHIETDEVSTKAAGGTKINGMVNEIGGTEVLINQSSIRDMLKGNNNNTIPHELGHTLNLHHVDQKENEGGGPVNNQYLKDHATKHKDNLMTSGAAPYKNRKTATKVAGFQMKWAKKAYDAGKINKH